MFTEFLEFADVATRESVAANLGIAANYKLACVPFVSEFVGYNDNLLQIFSFYSRISSHNHSGLFENMDVSHETMNFKKLEIFCRDYNVIPKLLIRDDLKIIWEMMAIDWSNNGRGAFVSMKFNDFKDMIVRMALLAYHKPGLKKLIISMEGFMPKNTEIVDCFCNFLHLHDVKYIANHLRTVGRQTQGEINFRSKDDPSTRTIKEINIDKEGRKKSQLKNTRSHTAVAQHLPPATALQPEIAGHLLHHNTPIQASNTHGADHIHGEHSRPVTAAQRQPESDIPKRGFNAFGEKIIVPFKMGYANPQKVVRPYQEPAGARQAVSLMPPALGAKLRDDWAAAGSEGQSAGRHVSMEETPATEEQQQHHTHNHHHHSGGSRHHHHHHLGDSGSVGSAQSSAFSLEIDNSVEALRQSIRRDYEPLLVRQLARYSYTPPRIELSDTVFLGGPFVDLGLLVTGSKVTINMSVTNGTADDLHIDCTTRNFKSSDTDLKTFSKALIPGREQ